MRNKPALTASDVQKIAAACKAEATKNKWNVSFAIVDDAGYLLHFERMDGAGPLTAKIAVGKAETAALSRRPSKFWEERIKERPAFAKAPISTPMQGGVPIMVQNDCVGAVGASGVQSHEDEQIANAGVAAATA
jgi:uncharacterized protein GlcG (DUF336 family)